MTQMKKLSTVGTGISTFDKEFATVRSDSDFEVLIEKDALYNHYQQQIRKYKLSLGQLKTQYKRIPVVAALRECESRIRYYTNQNANLKNGELPTKVLNHGYADSQELLREYQIGNDLVLAELEKKREQFEYEVSQNPQAQDLQIDIRTYELAIEQCRELRKPLEMFMRRRKNIGKLGLAYYNPDRTILFSTRIHNESS